MTALGTATEVKIGQLKKDILGALEEGDLTQPEVLKQVSGRNQHILTALGQLCDAGEVEKIGSGKKRDPFLYALVEKGLGKENPTVSGTTESEDRFSSALPNPMKGKGKGINTHRPIAATPDDSAVAESGPDHVGYDDNDDEIPTQSTVDEVRLR